MKTKCPVARKVSVQAFIIDNLVARKNDCVRLFIVYTARYEWTE